MALASGPLRDHLGSTAVVVSEAGTVLWRDLYLPYGDVRHTWRSGTIALQTGYRYTGQRMEAGVGAPSPAGGLDRGLYDYGARWYDPAIGRFTQPDPIVPEPGNPQALNRYAYVNNRPTVLLDSTGHVPHPNCQGSGAAIADCGVDGWYGYEDYAVRKQLYEMGQREGDKGARALLDVVSLLFEPADYAATIGACLGGDCSWPALVAMVLPGVPGALGRHADEVARALRDATKLLPSPRGVNPWLGEIVSTVFAEETVLYRVWGGDSHRVGAWLTPTKPASRAEARQLLALPPENAALYVSEVRVPAGTRVQIGTAAPAFGQPGGGTQVQLLDRIPPSAFGPGQALPLEPLQVSR